MDLYYTNEISMETANKLLDKYYDRKPSNY